MCTFLYYANEHAEQPLLPLISVAVRRITTAARAHISQAGHPENELYAVSGHLPNVLIELLSITQTACDRNRDKTGFAKVSFS